tara:strand:+ start:778 stop:1641 length:864 start_codon:yes stop_codon:yes gene_type:complete
MNLFGLEGSGFLLSVCLTLFLTGIIVFYVRQTINEQNAKIANMLTIVHGLASIPSPKMNTNDIHLSGGGDDNGIRGFSIPPTDFIQQQPTMEPISENSQEDKIDVSDNDSENSFESNTSDEDDEDNINNHESDNDDNDDNDEEGTNNQNNDNNNDEDDDDSDDDSDDSDDDNSKSVIIEEIKESDIKEININTDNPVLLTDMNASLNSPSVTEDESIEPVESGLDEITNLDEMLMGMIKTHEEKTSNNTSNLTSLKVGELRQMIKDKNIKVNNLSKLKKDECIELLS